MPAAFTLLCVMRLFHFKIPERHINEVKDKLFIFFRQGLNIL